MIKHAAVWISPLSLTEELEVVFAMIDDVIAERCAAEGWTSCGRLRCVTTWLSLLNMNRLQEFET
jgi:hypothetical protein